MKGSPMIIRRKLSWHTVYCEVKGERRESIERDRLISSWMRLWN